MGINKITQNKNLDVLFFLVGFIALLTQVIFMRQTLLLFEASEYVISIFLFFWLAGNGLGVYYGKNHHVSIKNMGTAIYAYGVIVMVFYYGLHFVRPLLLSIKTTELLIAGITLTALCVFVPSFYNGWLFSQFVMFKKGSQPVLRLYKLEAFAFFLAGAASTLVVYLVSDFYLMAVVLISLFILLLCYHVNIKHILLTLLLPGLLVINPWIQKHTWETLFPTYHYETTIQTPSGQMDVLSSKQHGEKLRLFQGSPVNMAKPLGAPEEAFYPALSQIKNTTPNLLIAGDYMLPLLEALSFSKNYAATILISDSLYFNELRKGFPDRVKNTLQQNKINIVHASIQNHLLKHPATYDLIYFSEQKPSLMENALLYFPVNLKIMKQGLKPDGTLSLLFSSESAYAGRISRILKGSVYNCMDSVFNYAGIFALDNYTILLGSENELISSFSELESALQERGIQPMYFNQFNVGNRLSNAKQIGVEAMKDYDVRMSFNKPIIYLAGLLSMMEHYSVNTASSVMHTAERIYDNLLIWQVITIAVTVLLFYLYIRREPFGGIVFHAGFTGIAAQMMFIYLYQLHFGNIYLMIGILVALFMVGLVAGLMINPRAITKTCPFVILLLVIALLVAMFLFRIRIIAFIGMFLAGGYTGTTFALNSASLERSKTGSGLGLYVNDLIGGLFGNLIIPLLFIPFLGFYMPLALFLVTGIITLLFQRKFNL
ncbi:MAG: hypothetical protein U9Q98_07765 [Bacteroidota bacterium]|nr:hypothetical protein [Bacteroidota bacterium]